LADPFASNLCVINGDYTTDTDVAIEESSAAGLFDVNRNKVIFSQNIHERLNPASLTKVMTALVAIKYGNTEDIIICSENVRITESGASLCGLKAGDKLTLNQALHALLIDSANDAAVAIAEHIGGSVEGFADMMNNEAILLGATGSHFVNPHGLTENEHYVTAYDMYLIMNAAMQYELFNEIIHMNDYTTVYYGSNDAEKEMSFRSTNLFFHGDYTAPDKITVIGGKTGTTNAAGNCLILLTKDTGGNPYISVILRASQRTLLYEEMIDLLEEINN
jgi:D-alanyl-D-alanine carboxypeptidase